MRTALLLPLFLLTLPFSHADAQWQSLGPGGGIVDAIAAQTVNDNEIVFAGTEGGLYRSTDGGISWAVCTNGLPVTSITSVDCRGVFAYAGTLGGELYRSTDGGASWSKITPAGAATYIVNQVKIDSNEVAAATAGGGIFISTDYGLTWEAKNTGLSQSSLGAIAIAGPLVLTGGPTLDIFRSSDLGGSWTDIPLSLSKPGSAMMQRSHASPGTMDESYSIGSLLMLWDYFTEHRPRKAGTDAAVPASADSVALATSVFGLFKSTDAGRTWSKAELSGHDLTSLTLRDSTLYVGDLNQGVYYSRDTGATWTQYNDSLPNLTIESIAATPGMLYAGTDGGVARSRNTGSAWTPLTSGMNAQTIWGLWSSGTTLFCTSKNQSAFRSTDGGAHWLADMQGLFGWIRTFASDGLYLYAGEPFGGGVFRSGDGGAHWTGVDTGLTAPNVSALIAKGGVLFAGTSGGGMFVSPDHGSHWVPADTGLPLSNATYVTALGSSDSAVFAATGQGIFQSADNGATWTSTDTSFRSARNALTFQSLGPIMFAGMSGEGVYKTTDRGATWHAANAGIASEAVYALAASGSMLFAGCNSGKIYASADSGVHWTNVSQGMPLLPVLYLTIQDGSLYAGTIGGSVWRRPLSEITVSVDEPVQAGIPGGFALEQNYPNPFNPTTIIKYTVAGSRDQGSGISDVKITVYDVLGREVAVLVNERKGPGSYEVRFDGSALASGVYVYRLTAGLPGGQAGSFVQSRKMVLLK